MRPQQWADWKIIGITGHRGLTEADERNVRSALKVIVRNKSVHAICVGGALGADTVALRAAHEFRLEGGPRLIVVVPDTAAKQPRDARSYFHLADQVIELHYPITKQDNFNAFRLRNEYLVDLSSSLVAFWNGGLKSGTAHAVRLANQVGLAVHHVKVKGLPD
jgi:predicted Rossmann fold nucleotide-binding protein DprA/Smf involved in DNA uptake